MRMSCNGCRVLRKGCSDDCSIRPCLEWIKTPESQAHATVFLAKFYGRAGLMNLINAGPQHLRPAIFKSLLYESCGRIVNPIFGSVGLVWSGNWQLCQDAVEAVLKGDPITQIATDLGQNGPPLRAGDIRHIIKDNSNDSLDGPTDQRRVRTRSRCKRSKRTRVEEEATRSPSHESSLSQQHSEMAEPVAESFGSAAEPERVGVEPNLNSDIEIELDLTLGFEPIKSCEKPRDPKPSRAGEPVGEGGFWKMELGLNYSAS